MGVMLELESGGANSFFRSFLFPDGWLWWRCVTMRWVLK